VFLAEIADAGAARFKDPRPERAEERNQGEVVRVIRQRGRRDRGFELQMAEPEGR